MLGGDLSLVGLALLAVIAMLLVVVSNWKLSLGLLALLYVGETLLISESWPISIAVVKLISGWMAVGMLGLSYWSGIGKAAALDSPGMPGFVFRGLTAVLVGVSVVSFYGEARQWFLGASPSQIYGGLFLFGLGMVQLGLSWQLPRIILGLLTVMAGFEILYATVEGSLLMTILLGSFNLGIAFVGSYLLSVSSEEPA
jgi:hypothetical protein